MTDHPLPNHTDLTERLGAAIARAAMDGDPLFGTVEVTITELAALLELLERQTAPAQE